MNLRTLLLPLLMGAPGLGLLAQAPMADIAYPFELEYQDLPGSPRIAYTEQAGEGPTLLLVHGLGSYAPAWSKLLEKMDGRHCIALDLPGYGKSAPPADTVSLKGYARTLASFIRAKNLEKVVLVGHSMGGQVGLWLALLEPGLLEGLVLLAPAGFETFTPQQGQMLRNFTTPEALQNTPPDKVRASYEFNFHGRQLPEDAAFMLADRLQMQEQEATFQAYCEGVARSVHAMLREPVFGRLPEIHLPVLVFFGQDDLLIPNRLFHPDLTPEKVGQMGVEQLPDARLVMLPDCGHFVLWDQAGSVAQQIEAFLERR